jgi:hypothetical protein
VCRVSRYGTLFISDVVHPGIHDTQPSSVSTPRFIRQPTNNSLKNSMPWVDKCFLKTGFIYLACTLLSL